MVHTETTFEVQELTELLKVMSDPTRILIAYFLQSKTYCVCEFVEMFEISQPAISQHIRKLKQIELITETRKGQWRYFTMNKQSPYYSMVQQILKTINPENTKVKNVITKEKPLEC
ncbi:metalloregulator ArsR/SmtB family transcription factor [Oceanobacillus kimchii]|uniref:metalloregulator ArsR/SmtB family transcription factor n=1 Tax=Oceanobacillus kimchii TaxID=746691 RepID=UPI0003462DD4|nr:metalloregulator ArsR/SmtB family transcription factor [Oceanobacillus kimchii]MCT1579013.1 metalloregulator ArsR/SmtB family transcription factor [Oceanobacillus kimchii]MCT2137459.1 metalloregulator ArsR/SmtB family transcription factor [Oceanobacillus kimchii]